MRNSVRAAAGLMTGALLAAGCGSAPAPRPPARAMITRGMAERVPAANPRPYGAADTAFGLDLLGAWCRQDPRANLVFSPESLATGLDGAYLGARGATARAMARVLHLPALGRGLLAGLHARAAALRAMNGPGVTVRDSDQVWADPKLRTLRSYLDAVATGYGAGVRRAPLLTSPNQAARQINAAIGAATRGHIRQLLPPGSLVSIAWVLTDALYLDADWATPFNASQTQPGRFAAASGQRVRARFMSGSGFRYVQAAGWTAVSLPYRGGKLAMVAMLPDSGAPGCPALTPGGLSTITRGLSVAPGRGGQSRLSPGHLASIALPTVNLRSQLDASRLLQRLGMRIAFGGGADFTGLSPQACCIGLVEHAATLRVAEKGTVASAATAVGLEPTAVYAPRYVSFDRPYLLLVTDISSGEPLFMARVANPSVP
jgi:serine protease inhibitor